MTFDAWKQAAIQNSFQRIKENKIASIEPVEDLAELKALAGIKDKTNISGELSVINHNEKAELMRKHNIQPGTPEWFKLWFSKPYLTGEKPIKD
jgi:hypothetical protein